MTGQEHYAEAEQLAAKATEYLGKGDGQESAVGWAAVAQVHAPLAVAAALEVPPSQPGTTRDPRNPDARDRPARSTRTPVAGRRPAAQTQSRAKPGHPQAGLPRLLAGERAHPRGHGHRPAERQAPGQAAPAQARPGPRDPPHARQRQLQRCRDRRPVQREQAYCVPVPRTDHCASPASRRGGIRSPGTPARGGNARPSAGRGAQVAT